MRDPLRQLFLRYRERGDVAALGKLFDRVAVELFRLALFLAPDASDAEDLVQGTFLTAIESAAGYDASRPLKPWLTGILGNLARRRRRERGRVERLDVPDGLEVPVEADSVGAAERAEVRACFLAAMRALPQPYRQVLSLHLVEGMTARRIGEVLERPAGTVRSQVVRGLAMLRRLMPAGVAGALAATLGAGHALAGVRVEVLRRASALRPAPLAVGSAPTAAAGLTLRTLVAAAALLVGVFAWARPLAGDPAAPSPAAPVFDAAEATLVDARASPDDAVRVAHSTPTPAGMRSRLEVRLVDGDGEPRAGLTCRLVDVGGPTELFAIKCLTDPSTSLVSDTEGRLAFEHRGRGPWEVWLVGTNARRRVEAADPGAEVVWSIPEVRVVRGRVIGADGSVLVGVAVFASATAGSMDVGVPVARTDSDGTFAFPLAANRTFVWAVGAGHRAPALMAGARDVELVAAAAPGAVEVAVVRRDGRPAGGAIVAAFPESSSGALQPIVFAVADAAGVARLESLPCGDLLVAARVGDASSERQRLSIGDGSTRSLSLWLEAGGEVSGRVVDAAGAPVRSCAVFAQTPPLRADSFDARLYDRIAWTDDDGRYVVTGTARGDVRVRLARWGTTSQERAHEALVIRAGERRRLDWRLDERLLHGRVVGAAPDVALAVVAVPVGPSDRLLPVRPFAGTVRGDGTFEVAVPPRFGAVAVLAAPADSAAPLVHGCAQAIVRDFTTPIELVANPARLWHARVRLAFVDERDRDATVSLIRDGRAMRAVVDARGRTSFDAVAAGHYVLRVTRDDGFAWTHGVEVPPDGVDVELVGLSAPPPGVLVVAADADARLELLDGFGCVVREVPPATAIPVAAGRYQLRAAGAAVVPQRVPIAIETGRETRCALKPQAGVRCGFEFAFDATDNPREVGAELHVAVFDRAGDLVVEDRVARPDAGVYRWTQRLAPGVYRVAATAAWGGAAAAELVVDGCAPVLRRDRLRLP